MCGSSTSYYEALQEEQEAQFVGYSNPNPHWLRDSYDDEIENDYPLDSYEDRQLPSFSEQIEEMEREQVAQKAKLLNDLTEPFVEVPVFVLEGLIDIAITAGLYDEPFNSLVPKSNKYKHSRIRVQLSRPLTVAEAEKLSTDHHTIGGRLNVSRRQDDGFLFKLRVSPNRTHVWVDADLPSRPLYDVVAAALDAHFVNVYPTAVRTFTEYHA